MGTDIFMFLEYRSIDEKNLPYWHLYVGSFRLFRNYDLFSLMGDERINVTPKPIFPFRGLPEEVSYGFCRDAAYVLVDYEPKSPRERVINRHEAEKEINAGELIRLKVSGSYRNWEWVTDNFRRASWLYASEYKLVLDEYTKINAEGDEFFSAILPMMQILNAGDNTRTRLVYYFL